MVSRTVKLKLVLLNVPVVMRPDTNMTAVPLDDKKEQSYETGCHDSNRGHHSDHFGKRTRSNTPGKRTLPHTEPEGHTSDEHHRHDTNSDGLTKKVNTLCRLFFLRHFTPRFL